MKTPCIHRWYQLGVKEEATKQKKSCCPGIHQFLNGSDACAHVHFLFAVWFSCFFFVRSFVFHECIFSTVLAVCISAAFDSIAGRLFSSFCSRCASCLSMTRYTRHFLYICHCCLFVVCGRGTERSTHTHIREESETKNNYAIKSVSSNICISQRRCRQ